MLIVARLEEFAYARSDRHRRGAAWRSRSRMLVVINLLERWSRRPLCAGSNDSLYRAQSCRRRRRPRQRPSAGSARALIAAGRWRSWSAADRRAGGQRVLPGAVARLAARIGKTCSATPDTRHAILLTLIVAPIAVVAATWSSASRRPGPSRAFDFRGRTLLMTLIDLPFSVSPVVAGLDVRAAVRPARLLRALAARPRHQDHLRHCRA